MGYQNSDLLGADFSIQAYFAQEDLVQIGTDISAAGLPPIFPSFFQTSSEEESYGLRSDLRFNVTDALRLNLGLDYRTEKDLSLLIISTAAGGAPAFFDGSSTVNQDPPFELETFGLFAQGTYEVTPSFRINAGLRYDYFDYTVGPSTPVFVPPPSLGFRPGGTGDGDGFSYNIGAIYDISDTTSVFASFAQGFSIPNFQLQARFVAPGVSVNDILEPVVVDSYEVGIRGELYSTEYSFAAFFAESDLGETAQIDPATGFGSIVRSPQRNYGFEFASRTAVTSQLDVSTSIAWNDGENDANNDGQFLALSSLSVLPLNIRIRADYQVNPRLALSGSINYLASRSDALNDGVDSLASE
ncbi:MAG: TonB-dependent receptor [Pseudomonadota bacterium]